MRHQRKGRRFGIQPSHRRQMLANLACSVLEHGRVKTTEAKAKEILISAFINDTLESIVNDRHKTLISRLLGGEDE